MVFGMPLAVYTLIHVLISLAGLGSGLVVLFGMLNAKRLNGWTALFLTTTVLTSLIGFGFPFEKLLPSHIVGMISLVLLALAIWARYGLHLTGAGRWLYIVGALTALYLNVFVAVFQLFLKIPVLKAAAPTQKEAPFAISQLLVLALFVIFETLAVKRFHAESPRAAAQRA